MKIFNKIKDSVDWRHSIYYGIYRLCTAKDRKTFKHLVALMLMLALVETLSVGFIAFYAAAISDPLATLKTPHIQWMSSLPVLASSVTTPKQLIVLLSLLLVLVLPIKNLLSGFVTFRIARFSAHLEVYLGSQMLNGILGRDYRWHLKQTSADLVQMVNWREHLGRGLVSPSLRIAAEAFLLIILFIGLLLTQPLVTLVFLFLLCAASIGVYFVLRRGLDTSSKACRYSEIRMNRQLTLSVHAVKDLLIAGCQKVYVDAFWHHGRDYARYFGKLNFWRESPLLVLEALGFVIIALVVLFMILVLDYSPLETTGTTALIAVTAWRSLPAVNRIVSAFSSIRGARPYVDQMVRFLASPSTNKHQMDTGERLDFRKSLRLEGVEFRYESGASVLRDFSLEIRKGQFVGIMGPSGCGKSTLIDLIVGLIEPDRGGIYVDDRLLTKSLFPSWRQKIAYVPQFPYIFDGTLAENVAFTPSADRIDREMVSEACRLASVDFLKNLPHGIDSEIGERGARLSGGQRQRIAIARALYRAPEVLILDEATSALDEVKDIEIRRLIKQLKGSVTLIVVSHRSSTVEGCDLLVNLKQANS